MSVCIAGTGWITPLGSNIHEVWNRLVVNDVPCVTEVADPMGKMCYPTYRVPQTELRNLPPHPRLRRASAISRFAAAAGLAAMKDAELTEDGNLAERTALVFGVANGGVVYTKRFYSDIVNTGAEAASPLLFPETVFNAAASHLAAIMGLSGTTYTVVGDGTVGLSALKFGEDLMASGSLDFCLVVAAEEADWLLCDAYHKWRLLRSAPPVELFAQKPKGTILSEGAGAVLLARNGRIRIAAVTAGAHFKRRSDAPAALADQLRKVGVGNEAIVIGSANGTFVDRAEMAALEQAVPEATLYSPKAALGESVGASTLWQVIVAAEALRRQELPSPQYTKGASAAPGRSLKMLGCDEISVLSCGLNQQVGAIRLTAA
jgi:3-oxoacyl-(acyl-carrier-protein) synthase